MSKLLTNQQANLRAKLLSKPTSKATVKATVKATIKATSKLLSKLLATLLSKPLEKPLSQLLSKLLSKLLPKLPAKPLGLTHRDFGVLAFSPGNKVRLEVQQVLESVGRRLKHVVLPVGDEHTDRWTREREGDRDEPWTF